MAAPRAGRRGRVRPGGQCPGRRGDSSRCPAPRTPASPATTWSSPATRLIRIALENGQNWKDLVKWNGLENPNVIEVGQVLRVVAPGTDPALAQTRPVAAARVETRPLTATPAAADGERGSDAERAERVDADRHVHAACARRGGRTRPGGRERDAAPGASRGRRRRALGLAGPGTVKASFDEGKVKGLVLGGKAGDPVLAAADGRVVYAGSGLRGYGNLVILKHNATYLTAYAHNQTLLVKEDQNVKRGQKIAEMGSTRRRQRAASFRDSQTGQADRSGQAPAAALRRDVHRVTSWADAVQPLPRRASTAR